jgi:DNA-binding transcriptional MerR regulator
MPTAKSLAELSAASGIPARTIRFYIARGLLNGPVKAGRAAAYTDDHLARLESIKQLQASGRMLAEIAHDLTQPDLTQHHPTAQPPLPSLAPSPWWQHAIQDDIIVFVRGDLAPWRTKQIRTALDDFAARIHQPQKDKEK